MRGNEKNGVSNRLDRKENKAELAPDVWKYNAFNQLTEQNGVSYEHSKNGHLIKSGKKNDQGQIAIDPTGIIPLWEFAYNTEERLTQVRKNNATVALYQYNPLGQRTSKTLPAENTTVHYLYSQEGMIGEYDDTGQLIQEYGWKPNSVWMTDPLFTRTADNRVHYYINDHLGTPQKAFRRNGKVTWKAKISAFGETEVWAKSELRNNLRFPGQYFDAETGLHYNYFRDYAAGLGRYVQSDPIGLLGGLNTFIYSDANTVNFTDPLGLYYSPKIEHGVSRYSVGLATSRCMSPREIATFAKVVTGALAGIPLGPEGIAIGAAAGYTISFLDSNTAAESAYNDALTKSVYQPRNVGANILTSGSEYLVITILPDGEEIGKRSVAGALVGGVIVGPTGYAIGAFIPWVEEAITQIVEANNNCSCQLK